MKSKLSIILIPVILIVIGVLVYFFVFKNNSSGTAAQPSGLVSTNTGAAQGIANQNTTGSSQTGSQVVQILRNLSVIRLDDAVFQNPAFAYLSDISITLPPPINQGRRNPFASVGNDTAASSGSSTTPTTGTGL